jgi:hypothetical protein
MTITRRRRAKPAEEQLPQQQSLTTTQPDDSPREYSERPTEPLVARDGDRLTVQYMGAKIGMGNYSTVEVDGSIYSRQMSAGEDIGEQWDRVYAFLRVRCESTARDKLKFYRDEMSKGRK